MACRMARFKMKCLLNPMGGEVYPYFSDGHFKRKKDDWSFI